VKDHEAARFAEEQRRWQRSPEGQRWYREDKARRERLTIAQGHSLRCGLLRCVPECTCQFCIGSTKEGND